KPSSSLHIGETTTTFALPVTTASRIRSETTWWDSSRSRATATMVALRSTSTMLADAWSVPNAPVRAAAAARCTAPEAKATGGEALHVCHAGGRVVRPERAREGGGDGSMHRAGGEVHVGRAQRSGDARQHEGLLVGRDRRAGHSDGAGAGGLLDGRDGLCRPRQ